jgi:hypothetical protein
LGHKVTRPISAVILGLTAAMGIAVSRKLLKSARENRQKFLTKFLDESFLSHYTHPGIGNGFQPGPSVKAAKDVPPHA